jgi:hypothetical protein
VLVGAVVVDHDVQLTARVGAGDLAEEGQELGVAVAGVAGVDHLAGGHFQWGEQGGGAVPDVVVVRFSGSSGRSGRIGAVRSKAWTCDFSSTESTIAFSGGCRYRSTTSLTLASSCGSVENLNVSVRQGCRPHLRQILLTQTWEIPSWSAISRLDQWVTPSRGGGGSNVASTTSISSTCAGRPGFGRSSSPPRPSAAYRFFQPITAGFDTPTRSTISFTGTFSAASSTIRARCAKRAGTDGERRQDSITSRSRGGPCMVTVNAMTHDPKHLTPQVKLLR